MASPPPERRSEIRSFTKVRDLQDSEKGKKVLPVRSIRETPAIRLSSLPGFPSVPCRSL